MDHHLMEILVMAEDLMACDKQDYPVATLQDATENRNLTMCMWFEYKEWCL